MKNIKKIPYTKEQLWELFDYNAGQLINRVSRGGSATPGKPAGYVHKFKGYVRVNISGQEYAAHRLIWIMFHGSLTEGLVLDHLNANRSDNRIENLEEVTSLENSRRSRNGFNQKIALKERGEIR